MIPFGYHPLVLIESVRCLLHATLTLFTRLHTPKSRNILFSTGTRLVLSGHRTDSYSAFLYPDRASRKYLPATASWGNVPAQSVSGSQWLRLLTASIGQRASSALPHPLARAAPSAYVPKMFHLALI